MSFVVVVVCCMLLYVVVVCCCSGSKKERKRQTSASQEDDEIIRDGKKIIVRGDGRKRALKNAEIANMIKDKNKNTTWVKNRWQNNK